STRITKKLRTICFNASVLSLATFFTGHIWDQRFGNTPLEKINLSADFVITICVMVLVQYLVNSGLAAIYEALKRDQGLWQTWRRHYLWTSITYVAGASGAAITAKLIYSVGFYAIIITTPIIGIIFFTYKTYLQNVRTAEANAEQARSHVEELNHYIAEQERIREQFSQIEKMSALGQLASGVAHDFNNCLAAMLGRAELLLKHTDDPRMIRGLDLIIKSAHDGARTVKRIQDFARQRREHDFNLLSVDQMLVDIAEMTRPRWKDRAEANNISILLDLKNNSSAWISGDVSELRDVLVNMVFNASDAMPEGGRLTLAAEIEGEDVVISVSDTGIGMSPEVTSKVFDPFFTTKGVEGMGLGLAVSYGIIRRHEGTIEVESQIGQGTTFRIKFRLAMREAPELSNDISVGKKPEDLGSLMTKILVIDDEERVRGLLREILEDDGHEVVLASGGHEGLTLFHNQEFDAVFTDVGMPGMSGWEVVRAIRESSAELPVAVITGWGEAVSDDEREDARVDWVVTKPFTMAHIGMIANEVTRMREIRAQQKLSFPPALPLSA
ncbi:MAG TPA: ATP-binding protein, partial [Pyrinomonadaceae bacterium]